MSYLDKCSAQTDLFKNKLKPSRNIIIFIVSENCYHAYTLDDMKSVMSFEKKHYIEGTDVLETFFYLPNGIRVDSSLSICFENKVNTMRLIEKGKFYAGVAANKQTFVYYAVEAISRQDIGFEEESVFNYNLSEPQDSDSGIKIDRTEMKQRDERKAKEKVQLKLKFKQERKKNDKDYVSIAEPNGVECISEYINGIKKREIWYKNGLKHRDNDLPAIIEYNEDDSIDYEEWLIEGKTHRDNDKPACIFYYSDGNIESERWMNNGQIHRNNDLPAYIVYYNFNAQRSEEQWFVNDQYHRNNDLPAIIRYYLNGEKWYQRWYVNGRQHRENELPACIVNYENGNKMYEEWWINNQQHRGNDLPARIGYNENNNNKEWEEWWVEGKQHRGNDLPVYISYKDFKKEYDEMWERLMDNFDKPKKK